MQALAKRVVAKRARSEQDGGDAADEHEDTGDDEDAAGDVPAQAGAGSGGGQRRQPNTRNRGRGRPSGKRR